MKRLIVDEFRAPRSSYRACRFPILLCHGLFGFGTIRLPWGQTVSYFNGVKEALEGAGATVVAESVPPVATIERRAAILHAAIARNETLRAHGTINILAHSMGGLDARLLVARLLRPEDGVRVATLTTLSTPHRGSPLADVFGGAARLLPLVSPALGGFAELTTAHMTQRFNATVRDDPRVRYFSYGARFTPSLLSPFWLPWHIIRRREGDNDGMVSVASARWGEYMGTLDNVDHGDVINMTHYKPRRLLNHNFSSQAMYLGIMDDLAEMGF